MKSNIELYNYIPGFNKKYQISTFGNIKSMNRVSECGRILKGKQLKTTINKGYKKVGLFLNKKQSQYFIHRLVAITFISNINNLPCVNHKDENKTNNDVDNLEWCTEKYNTNYGTGISKSSNKRKKRVYQYDLEGNLIKEYESVLITEKFGFSKTCVARCCRENFRSHKNFFWSYDNAYDYCKHKHYKQKTVYQYTKKYKLIKVWNSTMETEEYGYDHRRVSACCMNKIKYYKNYIWLYSKL